MSHEFGQSPLDIFQDMQLEQVEFRLLLSGCPEEIVLDAARALSSRYQKGLTALILVLQMLPWKVRRGNEILSELELEAWPRLWALREALEREVHDTKL